MTRAILMLIFIAALAAGCGTGGAARDQWVTEHGGLDFGDRATLATAKALIGEGGRTVTVRVLASDLPCAYGWADGSVYVTRGLLDLLNERELAAAIAHEVGHLLNGGHLRAEIVSLKGCRSNSDVEVRADELGVQMLERAGMADGRAAMVSMLGKVRACGTLSTAGRNALGRRIAVLNGNAGIERHDGKTGPSVDH